MARTRSGRRGRAAICRSRRARSRGRSARTRRARIRTGTGSSGHRSSTSTGPGSCGTTRRPTPTSSWPRPATDRCRRIRTTSTCRSSTSAGGTRAPPSSAPSDRSSSPRVSPRARSRGRRRALTRRPARPCSDASGTCPTPACVWVSRAPTARGCRRGTRRHCRPDTRCATTARRRSWAMARLRAAPSSCAARSCGGGGRRSASARSTSAAATAKRAGRSRTAPPWRRAARFYASLTSRRLRR